MADYLAKDNAPAPGDGAVWTEEPSGGSPSHTAPQRVLAASALTVRQPEEPVEEVCQPECFADGVGEAGREPVRQSRSLSWAATMCFALGAVALIVGLAVGLTRGAATTVVPPPAGQSTSPTPFAYKLVYTGCTLNVPVGTAGACPIDTVFAAALTSSGVASSLLSQLAAVMKVSRSQLQVVSVTRDIGVVQSFSASDSINTNYRGRDLEARKDQSIGSQTNAIYLNIQVTGYDSTKLNNVSTGALANPACNPTPLPDINGNYRCTSGLWCATGSCDTGIEFLKAIAGNLQKFNPSIT